MPRVSAWLPQSDFVNYFAADVDRQQANVMYAVQQPLHTSAFSEMMGTPVWKSLPSWYMVAKNDQPIPPDAERFFAQRMGSTTVEIASSHVVMASHAKAVAKLIETAAQAVTVTPQHVLRVPEPGVQLCAHGPILT